LQIVMLTDAQETARKIKTFLTSDMLNPIYTPPAQPPSNVRLNHFGVFWNVMHQLPFYVKNYDQRTQQQLIWFYEVGVRDTLPCSHCRKHYMRWLSNKPVSKSTGSERELNMWMFKLHDHVNWSSKKPNFQWAMYRRRWAPRNIVNRRDESDVKDNGDNKEVVPANSRRVNNQQKTALHPMEMKYDNEVPVYPADIPVYSVVDRQVPSSQYDSGNPQYNF